MSSVIPIDNSYNYGWQIAIYPEQVAPADSSRQQAGVVLEFRDNPAHGKPTVFRFGLTRAEYIQLRKAINGSL